MNRVNIVLLGIFFMFCSCGKESSCIKSTGNIVLENRSIDVLVDSIELNDGINLVLSQGNVSGIIVEGGANVLPYVDTEVTHNTLKISDANKCNFLRDYSKPITIYLTLPRIKFINYKGFGTLTNKDTLYSNFFVLEANDGTGSINLTLVSDTLSVVQHTGTADFTFTGRAEHTYLYTHGNGWFYFENFASNKVQVNHAGTGDMIVNFLASLSVELYALGNIQYVGEDQNIYISKHTGKGKIIKKND